MCPAYVQQWWSWTICGIKYRRLRIFHVGVTSVLCVVWLMAWIYLLASTKMDKNADMHMFYVLFETCSLFKRFHEMLFTNRICSFSADLMYYASPHEIGRHIVFSSVVCLSVCLYICLSVTLSCPLYIFWTPGGIYKLFCTNVSYNKTICNVCLTKVSWRSRSKFKIKHCMTVFWVCSLSFEPLVGFKR